MKKKMIITRDKGKYKFVNDQVYFWTEDSDIVNDKGCFHNEYCGNSLAFIDKFDFKNIFGFTPRKGSKRTILIDVR